MNGDVKQDSNIGDMIWVAPEIIAGLSRVWALKAGDIIFTGSPAGVGALHVGDAVTCGVEGLSPLNFTVGPR